MIFRENLIVNRPDKTVFMLNLLTYRRKILEAGAYELLKTIKTKAEGFVPYTETEQELVSRLEDEGQFLNEKQIHYVERELEAEQKQLLEQASGPFIGINLTYHCNANCIYCYQKQFTGLPANDTVMTPTQIDQIEEFYRRYADIFNINDDFRIALSGGEPLLPEHSSILQYIFEKWPQARLEICTNGINLAQMLELLPLDRLDLVKISLDGIGEVHNQRRPVAGVSDPFTATVEGIDKALASGLKVNLKITADRRTIHRIPDLLKFIDSKGWGATRNLSIGFTGVFSWKGGTTLDPAFNDVKEMVDSQIELRNVDPRIARINNNVFYGLQYLTRAMLRPANVHLEPRLYSCGILVRPNYTFDPSGRIYLCGDLIGIPEGVLGTYYPEIEFDKEKFLELRRRSVMQIEKCRQCAFRFVCGGGCPSTALRSKGDLMAPECNYFADEYVLEKLGELFL